MTTWTRRVTLAAIITMNLALGAAEPPKVTPSNDPKVSSATQWTLTTDDTHLNLSVANHRISIDSLKNPKQNWNWTPVASEVPLIKNVVINGTNQSPNWIYQNATVDRTTGTTVTLTFSSTAPQLELKSIWRARPGVGPVEHRIDIVNKSAGAVATLGGMLSAGVIRLGALKGEWLLTGKPRSDYDALLLICATLVVVAAVTLGLVPSVTGRAQGPPVG